MSQYEYDKDGFRFRKTKKSAWYYVRKVLMFFVVTLSLAFVYYLIFALIFSTDTEQRLKNENKMYAEELPVLESKEELLADVIEGLRLKDDRIYEVRIPQTPLRPCWQDHFACIGQRGQVLQHRRCGGVPPLVGRGCKGSGGSADATR